MLRLSWQNLFGPIATLAAVGAAFAVDRTIVSMPNPEAVLILAVVVAAYVGGVAPGLVSAAIALGYVARSLTMTGPLLALGSDHLVRLVIASVTLPAAAILVGLLQARARQDSVRRAQQAHAAIEASAAQLLALRATLDDLDYGIVVLDSERRVQFINRAFRRIWRVPDQLADSNPPFVRLMYHGRSTDHYAIAHDRLGAYVAEQLALIRSGEDRPLDIRLANGEALQFRCKALPGGRRLLTYGDVSSLVRHADMLERLASVDGMTGLYNRRHFLALAETEWSRFKRYGRPLAMLMVDIDLFKSINDRYGHDVGDRVIKEVAEILRDNKRGADTVGRIGGEEFALILPETTLDNACNAAERLRQKVAECVVTVDGRSVPVTISAGASLAQAGMNGITELMKQADHALYDAKRAGRNRVCRFGQGEVAVSQAAELERATPPARA